MRILIADNQSIIMDNVKKVISNLPNYTHVEAVDNGQEALDKVEKGQFDVAILSDSIRGMSGLDVLERLNNKKKSTKVLIYNEYPKEQSALKAFRLGASGYLSKFSALNVLNLALQDIALGDGYETN